MALQGGEKLRAKLEEIAKQIEGKHELRVGFLEGATYPDAAGTSVAQVAWWLNYGTKTAPPRPFFTDMVANKSDKWGDSLAAILKANDYNATEAMWILGEGITGQLSDALIALDSPALSPVTLMLRKMRIGNANGEVTWAMVKQARARVAAGEDTSPASTKVGVYTGHLLNTMAYVVDSAEERHLPKKEV